MSVATTAAVVGAVTAVAGTASSIYAASQSGGGVAGVKPPPYKPLDVAGTQDQALKTDIEGYDLSDADLMKRFPGLVAANQSQTQQAYQNLTGPLDPTVQNTFATNALEQSLGSTGGGNPFASIGAGAGSATNNAAAASLANQTISKQDYDRQYFDSLLMGNPQRAYGLSGGDVTNLSIANTQGQNQYNQAKYQYQVSKDAAGGGGGGL